MAAERASVRGSQDLVDQLSRSDLSQPIVPPPAYEPESAKKKGGNKASLENILG